MLTQIGILFAFLLHQSRFEVAFSLQRLKLVSLFFMPLKVAFFTIEIPAKERLTTPMTRIFNQGKITNFTLT